MPTPNRIESREDWVDRCMGDEEANKDFPDADQRFAFCNSKWDQHKKRQRRSRRRRGVMKV